MLAFGGAAAPGIASGASTASPADQERTNGLDKLKSSFLLYLIGSVISFVPLAQIIGGLLDFVALIMFILGWRALGRSSLPSAKNYGSTGRWIVYAIVITIVVGVAGAILLFIALVGVFISAAAAGNPPSFTALMQNSVFSTFYAGFFGVLAAADVVALGVWYMVTVSLRRLGAEISQPSLGTAGRLFLLSAAIGFVFIVSLSVALFSGVVTYASFSSLSYFGGPLGLSFFYLVTIPEEVVLAVASYIGYKGVGRASDRFRLLRSAYR